METLEHVNYHYEILNEIAGAVSRYSSGAFITLPNNKNWIFNVLGWNHDHIIAFFPDIADRFIRRSDLGAHDIQRISCFQKYLWYWWLAYALSGFQSFSIGFVITPHNQGERIWTSFTLFPARTTDNVHLIICDIRFSLNFLKPSGHYRVRPMIMFRDLTRQRLNQDRPDLDIARHIRIFWWRR